MPVDDLGQIVLEREVFTDILRSGEASVVLPEIGRSAGAIGLVVAGLKVREGLRAGLLTPGEGRGQTSDGSESAAGELGRGTTGRGWNCGSAPPTGELGRDKLDRPFPERAGATGARPDNDDGGRSSTVVVFFAGSCAEPALPD